jgi:hypothetical protein
MVASPGRAAGEVNSPTRCPPSRKARHPEHAPGQGHELVPMVGKAGDLMPAPATQALGRPSDEMLTGQPASCVCRDDGPSPGGHGAWWTVSGGKARRTAVRRRYCLDVGQDIARAYLDIRRCYKHEPGSRPAASMTFCSVARFRPSRLVRSGRMDPVTEVAAADQSRAPGVTVMNFRSY